MKCAIQTHSVMLLSNSVPALQGSVTKGPLAPTRAAKSFRRVQYTMETSRSSIYGGKMLCTSKPGLPARCGSLRDQSLVGRKPFRTLAVATSGSEIKSTPKVPDGTLGIPFIGESMEWISDMNTFFGDRCFCCFPPV